MVIETTRRAPETSSGWSLARAAVEELLTDEPHLAALLHDNLAATLSGRLRRANDEIRALAH